MFLTAISSEILRRKRRQKAEAELEPGAERVVRVFDSMDTLCHRALPNWEGEKDGQRHDQRENGKARLEGGPL
jgi:molybdenum-dependent DNA-binding transcriptional regulator ModE